MTSGLRGTFILGLIISLISVQPALAQRDEEPTIPLEYFYAKPKNNGLFRRLLSKFHFSFSTGYGRTFYNQDLSDFSVLQKPGAAPVIFDKDINTFGGTISSVYEYWFNDVKPGGNATFNSGTDYVVGADSSDLRFKAPGFSIPLNFSVHFEIDRYRIGGGATFEYHRPGKFEPTAYQDQIAGFDPDFGSTLFKKYYGLLGVKVYEYYDYSLSIDANIGAYNLTDKFNNDLIQKGIYVNIGPTVERNLSEYFRVFVKSGIDIKNFTLNIPETDLSVPHSMNAVYLSFGLTYRIPPIPKCFIKQCTTQINHQHGNKVYRSRVHPFYKKQNPHHGENYPRLIKYKRKNRDKMNPY